MAAAASAIPSTMSAVVAASESGGHPTVRVESRPVPAPEANQVLIQVYATGTNRAEILQVA
jgi:NADPH:quinone reductase-like Zn-dependent oxidoreductase